MPFSSRGAQYFGNALKFLNCKINHEKLADDLYGEMQKSSQFYGTTNCHECGAFITVSVRGNGEWEHKIFSRGNGKER